MLLSASQLRLFYGDIEVFAGVDADVNEQSRIGLVGSNGSGKTSLLRVLVGELDPDEGTVSTNSGLRLAYVPQLAEHDAPGTLRDGVESAFARLFKLEADLADTALDIQQRQGGARSSQLKTSTVSCLRSTSRSAVTTTRARWSVSPRASG